MYYSVYYYINSLHDILYHFTLLTFVQFVFFFRNSIKKLFQSEKRTKEYNIFNTSGERLDIKSIREGEDFEILFETNIDRGMFGRVSWCRMRNKDGEEFSTVMKRILLDQPVSTYQAFT